jgi:hypothetical protein
MADLASALLAGTRKRKFHEQLAADASSTAPTPSWGAALARALQGGMAGMIENRERDSDGTEFDRLFGQQASVQPPQSAPLATALSAPQAEPQSGNPGFANAIASIESGGKYDRLGPVTKTGDRAYGKYEVMGANIPQWTKVHLGQEMTPDAFLSDPKAQDAVFNGRFGQYAQKYGPEGAAKAWFAGEKGMNNPNARDQLGTTVAAYAQKFNKALGPQAPQQEADLPPGAQLAQGQMPPQMAQPQQTRVAPQIPPHIMGQARKLWQEGDRAAAGALMQPYLTPKDQWEVVPSPVPGDKNQYQRNTATRELKPLNPQPFAVNIDNKGESKFTEKAGELQAKRYDELAAEAPAAKQMQSDVAMLRDLGEKIGTGKIAEFKAVIGPYANALGIDVKGLSDIQAFEAVVNRVAPQMRVKGTGAQSDFELRNFLKQFQSIGNTPEANALIDKTMQGFIQNKMSAAEIGSMALNGEITRKEADKRLRELPDPMAEWREHQKTMKKAAEPTVIDGYKIRVK